MYAREELTELEGDANGGGAVAVAKWAARQHTIVSGDAPLVT